jgi:hypothetical protein
VIYWTLHFLLKNGLRVTARNFLMYGYLYCVVISFLYGGITPRKGRHLLNEGSGTNVPSY